MISSIHIEKKMARTICQLRDVVNIIYLEIQFNSMTSDKDISMKLPDISKEKFVNNKPQCRF